jgi:molybdate transport system substrate-binding protein
MTRLFAHVFAVVLFCQATQARLEPGTTEGYQALPLQTPALTVFAASDLVAALKELIPAFEGASRSTVTLVTGSTGTLAQQIQHGAPADVFFAANESFVDDLAKRDVVLPGTRTIYARGRIVIAALKSGPLQPRTLEDLTKPGVRRIAMANPAHAPYGLAAQQALEAAGLWGRLKPRLVYAENVQQALQFVQSGAAEAGIVARSIVEVPELSWVLVDASRHAPLNQAAAVLKRTRQPALAMSFLRFVSGGQGRSVMKRLGFLLPGDF